MLPASDAHDPHSPLTLPPNELSLNESSPPAYELPEIERPASATPTEADLEQSLPGGIETGGRDPYAVFRYRDYLLYSLGSMLAAVGGQMQSVAISWELYERVKATSGVRSAELALGFVGLTLALPVILLALPAGQVADRFNRKHIMLSTRLGAISCSLALAALSYYRGPIYWIYGILLLAGIANTFNGPANSAILPQFIPQELLSSAIAWGSTRWQLAAMIGPALGGFAIAASHNYTLVYVIAALCGAICFCFMVPLRVRYTKSGREPVTFQTLLAGIRFVRDSKIILATITLDMFAVLLGGAVSLLPVFARESLHIGADGLGWLRAAPAFGALGMALAIAHLPPMRHAGKMLLWAVIGFGLATVGFGLSRNFWLSMALLISLGALDNISVTIRHTLVQILTPDAMRGRVSAVNSVFIGASNELGDFESGVTANLFGHVTSVVAGGIGSVLVVLIVDRVWPQVRDLTTLAGAAEK